MKMAQNGIIYYLKEKYFPKSGQCRVDADTGSKAAAMNLNELAIAFVMLGLGLALSVVAFLLEMIFGCKK